MSDTHKWHCACGATGLGNNTKSAHLRVHHPGTKREQLVETVSCAIENGMLSRHRRVVYATTEVLCVEREVV